MIVAAVERMDLSAFYEQIRARGSAPGRPALDPAVLVAVALRDERGRRQCKSTSSVRASATFRTDGSAAVSDAQRALAQRLPRDARRQVDTLMTQLLASPMHKGLVKLRRVTQDGMRLRAHAGTGKSASQAQARRAARRSACADRDAQGRTRESDTSASLDREQAAKMRAAAEGQRKIEVLNDAEGGAHARAHASAAGTKRRAKVSRSTTTGHESARPTLKPA
ncbi:MAG: hypothetical protein U0353_05730 [Sandaracinus sp.]